MRRTTLPPSNSISGGSSFLSGDPRQAGELTRRDDRTALLVWPIVADGFEGEVSLGGKFTGAVAAAGSPPLDVNGAALSAKAWLGTEELVAVGL